MKYLYTIVAIFLILIVTFFTFWNDEIYYNYAKYDVSSSENIKSNSYYYNYDFNYIEGYEGLEIHNKKELFETIYYVINSGATNVKRYFSIEYEDYEKDYNEIFSEENKNKLNNINNFVHPYNSFETINVSLKGYELTIDIDYKNSYPEEKKMLIDNKVNEIINSLITRDMDTKDKIKVIHDYIINNTKYDTSFCAEENQEDCTSTSVYQADTAYGVLFEHYGICSGYTDLMAIFLNKLEIPNYRITNETHTWNAVRVNNRWYHLDATWDDPINDEDILSHTYFLITTYEDSLQSKSHTFDKEIFTELS